MSVIQDVGVSLAVLTLIIVIVFCFEAPKKILTVRLRVCFRAGCLLAMRLPSFFAYFILFLGPDWRICLVQASAHSPVTCPGTILSPLESS
ncbi:uncharacterized protein ASPGLDRAFT_300485 [Aspergillus glaucus CBS 516.65]|uniref:Uncharacterized protein n=1 Tax=Aspergillus glaucus CBS 516.65 TaxID=1160497 RepID=A0A1L9VJT5_ASPGL|nr:hypothetical protein ASPGLDRAFT_300485 [Aspergillus glaucus CBS 516.65]OJJ84188.1 hypothetical protein ASPGLDRAFT_300485 [Aspergillus glaucus CBS 516.65]